MTSVTNIVQSLQNYTPPLRSFEHTSLDLDTLFVSTLTSVCSVQAHAYGESPLVLGSLQHAASLVRHLTEPDFEYLDPLFAVRLTHLPISRGFTHHVRVAMVVVHCECLPFIFAHFNSG